MSAGAAPLRVLVVDDDAEVRAALLQTLELADIPAEAAGDARAGAAALKGPGGGGIGAVLCDVKMPGPDGMSFLAERTEADPDLPIVMLTGHGDVPMAVAAMRAGAYDFLEKPAPGPRLIQALRRALDRRALVLENRRLRAALTDGISAGAGRIIGDAPSIRRFRDVLERVAASDADLLIHGETGAGKELTARAAHALSPRRDGRFVAINCGALPAELAESELFGHEPGAFTGAVKRRVGKFAYADGGTVFLDEIESMPLGLQVALLRVLQEREVVPLGGNAPQKIDVRVIAATKADLRAAADAGTFREDLFYRLEVARLEVPPLRERIEDAPLLFERFVVEAAERRGTPAPVVSAGVRAWLLEQRWPGNVRELKNAAERLVIGLPVGPSEADGEPAAKGSEEGRGGDGLAARLEAVERRLILEALEAAGGRVAEACARLRLPRNTLYDKMKKYGLRRPPG